MKKFMTIAALAAFAAGAHAATITWGLGADVYLKEAGSSYNTAVLANDASAPSVTAGSYLALVYVGQNVNSFSIDDISAASVVATAPYAIDTTYSVDYDPYQTDTITTAYSDGAAFGIVWFDAGPNGGFSLIQSIDDGSTFSTATVVSDMSARGSATILPAADTNGWGGVLSVSSVPEPATGALALAGVALLFKRRKA